MEWTSDTAAAVAAHYPGFCQTSPQGGAQRAWHGILRPLPANEERGLILGDLERDAKVHLLKDGTLHHDPSCHREHDAPWYANNLAGTRADFEILLLDFGPSQHPRVYSTKPAISGLIYPNHPHLRRDQVIWHAGTPLHALCTYLASDGANPADEITLVRALDFASIFLAKHMVWTKTASLTAHQYGKPPRTICSDPSGIGLHFRPTTSAGIEYRWDGHWPGTGAPHTPAELLASIHPDHDCPCGRRAPYAACCRNDHGIAARQLRNPALVRRPAA